MRAQLLIAAPSLQDYFRRTVLLVLEHTPEGAMGVVLNRVADARVADVVPALADLPDADQPVRLGGPVATDSVVALGDFERTEEAGTTVLGTLGTLDPEAPNESLRRLRVYAGYAGWGPGQLDGELEQDAWIVVDAKIDDPFEEGDLWSEAVARKGGRYRLLSTMPSDPSLN
jgi:putative transcriptional regulator